MTASSGTLLLTRSEVRSLLRFEEYIDVVENAFRQYAEGKALKPALMHVDSVDGEFHMKAGGLELGRRYFALKANGGFFQNMRRFGMPNIQGIILLCDGENGYPLAIMDSTEITIKRTGAAAAIAAKYLARPDSSTVTICGGGTQGAIQLLAMKTVLPVKRAFIFDIDEARARSFAEKMASEINLPVSAVADLREATRQSDVCVTCTPSRKAFLNAGDIVPGTFIAAMGADSPDKQELDPALLRKNKVVVDLVEQCMHVGELHHAIGDGMNADEVHAELGDIVAGRKPGRTSPEEIIVFDATGTALQDVAAAAAVYERAERAGEGHRINLFA
jgi:ornithine cyclodeaminase/alanine dehydrogenase